MRRWIALLLLACLLLPSAAAAEEYGAVLRPAALSVPQPV